MRRRSLETCSEVLNGITGLQIPSLLSSTMWAPHSQSREEGRSDQLPLIFPDILVSRLPSIMKVDLSLWSFSMIYYCLVCTEVDPGLKTKSEALYSDLVG